MSSPLTFSTILSTSPSFGTTLPPAADAIAVFQNAFLWALVVGFVLAFLLGFGMGANDVANAFGTSVGSNVLTMRNAFILATIMETLGAVLVGFNVTDAMRKEVLKTDLYADHPSHLLLGQLAILGGGSVWLLTATFLRLPVSTTHSIVGAILGFTVVMNGLDGISWKKIAEIAFSWVLSPALSGFVSAFLYMIVDFAVLRRRNPVKCGLRALPVFYFFCIAFNTFAVVYNGSKLLGLSKMSLLAALSISVGLGACAALLFHFVLRPRILSWIYSSEDDRCNGRNNKRHFTFSLPETNPPGVGFMVFSAQGPPRRRANIANVQHNPGYCRVFTACFAGFAHGANDVSNSIAPLVALLSVWTNGSVEQREQTPIWLLLFGVFAICSGLWLLGHRVIETVGQKMSHVNPCSGFTIEFGAAVTALTASKLGLPISTTHCLVGSVVAVGSIKSGEGVDWHIFASIATSWLVTLPVSAAVSAGLMYIMKTLVL
uniref:Phosphate transporter n=1 Tax=Globodera pallida TaxID=36090 RepID=A0A183BUF6_GLOPA